VLDKKKNEIQEFLQKQAIPYEPENDSYEKKPFDKPVTAGKNTPIYNAHSYHTKVPYQGIIPFIEHYTEPGDLILDPFCGSGMTGVAALLSPSGPRKAIMNDLSPAAVHIARNYCTPCDAEKLIREFERIKAAVNDEFKWLYETYHVDPKTGERIPASIQYTIWSDVYKCHPKKRNPSKHPLSPDGCQNEIILWDAAVDQDSGEVKDKFKCPFCGETWRKTELQLLRSVPIVANYVYVDPKTNKKRRGEHRITEFDLARIQEIESKEILYWYPQAKLKKNSEMYIRCALHLRQVEKARDFYTKRNLWALAKLWDEASKIRNSRIKSMVQFAITGTMQAASKMNRHKPSFTASILMGTLYIGSFVEESSMLRLISPRIEKSIKLAETIPSGNNVITSTLHAGDLNYLDDQSIDYIFTDPPFGSNIFYADCSFLWESWLGEFTDESLEAVWNKSRKPSEGGKILEDYRRLMFESFQEMYRVLKPNRWATVVFSNSDDKVWEAIQEAAHQAGFAVYGGKEFDKIQRSFKGIKGEKGEEKVISKDVLLNLHKPKKPLVRNGKLKKIADIEGFVLQQIMMYLQYLSPGAPSNERTIEAITRALQRRVIDQGYSMRGLSVGYVADVLSEARRKSKIIEISGNWFIKGGDQKGAIIVSDESSAIIWLTELLEKEPKRLDEIDPLWKQETLNGGYHEERGLQELLEDFFILSDEGTYRIPDDHERQILKGHEEANKFRECALFLNGRLEMDPSLHKKFEWIEVLAKREEWKMILDIERTMEADPQWRQREGGKDAWDRIRYAKVMIQQKGESAKAMRQKSLF